MKHVIHITVESDEPSTKVESRIHRMIRDRFPWVETKASGTNEDQPVDVRIASIFSQLKSAFGNLMDLIDKQFPEMKGLVGGSLKEIAVNTKVLNMFMDNSKAVCAHIADVSAHDAKSIHRSFVVGEGGVRSIASLNQEELQKVPDGMLHMFCHIVADANNVTFECPMPREEQMAWLQKQLHQTRH